MGAGLATQLELMARGFDRDVREATETLVPREEKEYLRRTGRFPLFSRIAVATPEKGVVRLELLDPATGEKTPMSWPAEWDAFRREILRRVEEGYGPPRVERDSLLWESPQFRDWEEVAWYLFELDERYLRETYWPEVARKYLGEKDFDVSVTVGERGKTLYGQAMTGADATTRTLRPGRKKGGPEGGGEATRRAASAGVNIPLSVTSSISLFCMPKP